MGVLPHLPVSSSLPRLWSAWRAVEHAQRIERLNEASKLLFIAAHGYGFERGRAVKNLESLFEVVQSLGRLADERTRDMRQALLGSLAVILAVTRFVSRRLILPLKSLTTHTKALAAGRYAARDST